MFTEACLNSSFSDPFESWRALWAHNFMATPDRIAGAAVHNADNVRLAAIQMYLISTDFVSLGVGRDFQRGGFGLGDNVCVL